MKLTRVFLFLLKEIIAPKTCCHCGTFFTYLCRNCYEQIEFNFNTEYLRKKLLSQTPFLDYIITVGTFFGPLKSLVLSLKYQGQIEVAYTLANLAYYSVWFPKINIVTFVPAHRQRLKKRGINQSELLAEHLAGCLNTSCSKTLVRSKKIAAQASIQNKKDRAQRQINTMAAHPKATSLENKSVLIVDDVFTTGATLNEAARVLKEELGAKRVIGFAIAQA